MKPATQGLDRGRLQHLKAAVESDISSGLYYGAAIAVARHGELGMFETIGHADAAGQRPVQPDSVFSPFSVTKAFTNVAVFQAIEQGRLALTMAI